MSSSTPTGFLDVISPAYMRSALLSITPADPLSPARAFQPIPLLVTATGMALDTGLVFPIDMTITPPSARRQSRGNAAVVRHTFQRAFPPRISFTPREGGTHLVRLAERYHNLFWGYLVVDVQGTSTDDEDA